MDFIGGNMQKSPAARESIFGRQKRTESGAEKRFDSPLKEAHSG
jgi:hypothetical protein